jgi:hypothetical protein
VRNEKFTADYARRAYGVVVEERTWMVDVRATEALRDTMRREGALQKREEAMISLPSAGA